MTDDISASDIPPIDAARHSGRSPRTLALTDELVPILYRELKSIARRVRARRAPAATLQTTALVNETYLKLRGGKGWNDDQHFLCAAALAMRHILVNHAEMRTASKRGAGQSNLPLTAADQSQVAQDSLLIDLDEALERLSHQSPRLAQVVECRYFGGYDDESTARALDISERTVRRDWALARAWLHRELQRDVTPNEGVLTQSMPD